MTPWAGATARGRIRKPPSARRTPSSPLTFRRLVVKKGDGPTPSTRTSISYPPQRSQGDNSDRVHGSRAQGQTLTFTFLPNRGCNKRHPCTAVGKRPTALTNNRRTAHHHLYHTGACRTTSSGEGAGTSPPDTADVVTYGRADDSGVTAVFRHERTWKEKTLVVGEAACAVKR